ncbi:Hint domain-containing protein [Marivita sp.]|uniref:Hint domain-containing protein n=1 Tax=Marivita sp. TaxID=2003365 RepID=UPI00260AE866|nr:Hint domain-containing protein [Marivita sp.]
MPNIFNVFSLGTGPFIDPTEGNDNAENAGALVGLTFGGPGSPLYGNVQEFSPGSTGWSSGDTTGYDQNNFNANDTFRLDGGADRTVDGLSVYNATLTYIDGTTATITAVVFQDTADNLYLAPELGAGSDQTALEAKAIESLTLNSISSTFSSSLNASRAAGNYVVPDGTVDGTSGNDLIKAGFLDAQGDAIDGFDGLDDSVVTGSGNDQIASGKGNDTVDAGDGNDNVEGGQGNDTLFGGSGDDDIGGDGQWLNSGDYASGPGVVATNLTIINSADGPIELWWIDGSGLQQFYATIQPGETYVQPTFEDHNWLLNDEDGFYLEVIEGAPNQTVDYGANGLNDSIDGGIGNDTVRGLLGDDTLDGGAGNDTIIGGYGDDLLIGGTGHDRMEGGAGADFLNGDDGADSIFGGDGNDTIDGGGNTSGTGPGQVVLLNFEDGASGTAADDTGNGNIGIYQSGAAAGGTGWDGSGTAVTLDGTDDYVEIPDDPSFQLTEGTISIRFNVDNLDGDQTLVSRDSSGFDGGGHIHVWVRDTGAVLVRMQDTDTSYEFSSGSGLVSPGSWHHMALSFGADGARLYLDGVEVASDAYTGGISGNTEPFTLGAGQQFSGDNIANALATYFDGQLDEFAVFDTQLSAASVAAMNTGGVATLGGGDTLSGGAGNDSIVGGASDDLIDGGDGNDTLLGGEGADSVDGGTGNDILDGGTEDDVLRGGDGNDTILGQSGNDYLEGSAGTDLLFGHSGNDTILGGTGNDTIVGGDGADSIDGGIGRDRLEGGAGADTLTGGADADVFLIDDGGDLITDFDAVTGIGNANTTDNDFVDLTAFYNATTLANWNANNPTSQYGVALGWLRADQEDGVLDQAGGLQLQNSGSAVAASELNAENTGVVCFAAGTLILTPWGEVPIEALSKGDLVVTRDNGPKPIVWIGTRHVSAQELKRNPKFKPIWISHSVTGGDAPMIVSRQHGLLVQLEDGSETLVRAGHLARMRGGKARVMEGCRKVTYFHLMFEAHEILYANGGPAESFYPGANAFGALANSAREEVLSLFPGLYPSRPENLYGDRVRPVACFRELPGHLTELAHAR